MARSTGRTTLTSRRLVAGCERGALSMPLLLACLAISLAGFGTWGLLRRWRHLTETQLRLDACVGEAALALKKAQERIEAGNQRMRIARTAEAASAALANPAALKTTRALLQLQARLQDLDLAAWKLRQAAWIARRGCDSKADLPFPLPSLGWMRPPDDVLGPLPLRRAPSPGTEILVIRLLHSPRAAAAIVRSSPKRLSVGGIIRVENEWKADWTVPGGMRLGSNAP